MSNSLLAKVKKKMAEKAAKKAQKNNEGRPGFFNLTDDLAKTDTKGVFVNEARMLPTSLNSEENDPFRDVWIHYGLVPGSRQSFVCPDRQFGKPCPACEKTPELWDMVRELDAKKGDPAHTLAKSFFPTQRFFSPVIRRVANEDGEKKVAKGAVPEWYVYNEKRQEQFFGWVQKKVIGDITDIESGRDFVITKKTKEVPGVGDYGDVSQELSPEGSSPLGTPEEVQKMIDQIPDLMELMDVWPYDKIEEVVNEYLEMQVGDGSTSESKYGKSSSTTESLKDDVDRAFEDLKAS